MKKTKLKLDRTTITVLTRDQLDRANGGGRTIIASLVESCAARADDLASAKCPG